MKIFTIITVASAHVCLKSPQPQQNANCLTSPLNTPEKLSDYCGFAQDMSVTPVEMTAGEVFQVEFGNPNVDPSNEALKNTADQARHGGGYVELSLSYDQGKSFNVIGRYLRSAPDVFFKWPILIPSDAPSGKALFSWTWFPSLSGAPEMYMDCSVVNISGGSGTPEAFKSKYCPMIEGNLPGRFERSIKAVGDGSKSNTSGRGPIQAQVAMNTGGQVVTCEDGGVFDVDAANDPSDVDGVKQQTTNGTGPSTPSAPETNVRRPRGPEIVDPEDDEEEEEEEEQAGEGEGTEETERNGNAESVPSAPIDITGGALTQSDTDTGAGTDPASDTNPASDTPAPATETPAATEPASAGSCDPTKGIYYCSPDPSLSYICNHSTLIQMPVAAGTQCQCTTETSSEFCVGQIVAA